MADFSALKTSIQNYIKQNGNEEITGNLLQQILLSMVSTLGDSAINDLVAALNAEIANRGNADTELGGRITTLQGVVNGIKANVENGYVYAGIATPSTTPVSGKVFYLALTAGTYTNFGSTVVPQGINILKYNGSAWSLDSFLGLDDAPTQGSNNLVKSGGVLDSIIKDGSAFDLSAYNSGATYADLSAALTALNALPAAYKKGGMSIKYVQTSDNKYVQFRLMSDTFNTTVANWQGVDDVPTAGSENLVKSGGVELSLSKITEIKFIDGKYNDINDGHITTDNNIVSIIVKINNVCPDLIYIGNIVPFNFSYYNDYPSSSTYIGKQGTIANAYYGWQPLRYDAKYISIIVDKTKNENYQNAIILFDNFDKYEFDSAALPKELNGFYIDLNANIINDVNFKTFLFKIPVVAKRVKIPYESFSYVGIYSGNSIRELTKVFYSSSISNNLYGKWFDISAINCNYIEIMVPSASTLEAVSMPVSFEYFSDEKVLEETTRRIGKYIDTNGNLISDNNLNSLVIKVPENAKKYKIITEETVSYISTYSDFPNAGNKVSWNPLYNYDGYFLDLSTEKYIQIITSNTSNKNDIQVVFDNYDVIAQEEDSFESKGYIKENVWKQLEKDKGYSAADGSIFPSTAFATLKKNVESGEVVHIAGKKPQYVFFYSGEPSSETLIEIQNISDPWKTWKQLTTFCPLGSKYVVYEWNTTNRLDFADSYFYRHKSKSLVICAGDSLTHGFQGQGNVSYPDELQMLLDGADNNLGVINAGYDGQNCYDIMGRLGCLPVVLKSDIALPASTEKVLIGTQSDTGLISCDTSWEVDFLLSFAYVSQYLGWFNPVIIDGIECMITNDGNNYSSGNYYINRVSEGEAITLKAGTPIYTQLSKISNPYSVILWQGTNYNPYQETLVKLCKAVRDYYHQRFIVLSPFATNQYVTVSHIQSEEVALMQNFGLRFFNTRIYLIENGLDILGVEPTAEDTIAINEGKIPPSITVDGTHLKPEIYSALAQEIYNLGKKLGDWN